MKKRSAVVCLLIACFIVASAVSVVNAQITSGCRNFYWIDNTHKECELKLFCGDYMYDGLLTFSSKTQCLKAVARICPAEITCAEGYKPCTGTDGCPSCCPPIIGGGGNGFQLAVTGGGGDNVLFLGGVPVYFGPDVQVYGTGNLGIGNAVCLYSSGYSPVEINGQTYDSRIDIRTNPYYDLVGQIYFKGVVIDGIDGIFTQAYIPGMSVAIDDDGRGWSMEVKALACGGDLQDYHLSAAFTDDVVLPPPAPSCQNYPPPGFCPEGYQIIITGYDDNGCAIYGCEQQ